MLHLPGRVQVPGTAAARGALLAPLSRTPLVHTLARAKVCVCPGHCPLQRQEGTLIWVLVFIDVANSHSWSSFCARPEPRGQCQLRNFIFKLIKRPNLWMREPRSRARARILAQAPLIPDLGLFKTPHAASIQNTWGDQAPPN